MAIIPVDGEVRAAIGLSEARVICALDATNVDLAASGYALVLGKGDPAPEGVFLLSLVCACSRAGSFETPSATLRLSEGVMECVLSRKNSQEAVGERLSLSSATDEELYDQMAAIAERLAAH